MSRRWLPAIAVASCGVLLLSGCGGRPVVADTSAFVTGPAVVDPAAPTGTDMAATGAVAKVDKTQPPSGPAVVTPSPTAKNGRATPAKARGTVKATGTAESAVETVVANNPMFGGTDVCRPATLSEVPIGNVSTLSGVVGEVLSPGRTALETAVAAQNACGGLNGHRIKLYIDDDQGDPSTASTKVQDMILKKKVLAFVGNIQILTIDAVLPVINRYKIPIIGGDIASNTWWSNPLLFPQLSPGGAVAYGYLKGATEYFHKTTIADVYCIEIPRGCSQNDQALKELAAQAGVVMKKSIQISITAPSYVQQCLDLKASGAETLALLVDAATMVRLARSCQQVGYFPKLLPCSLGVGNDRQFLTGNKWLADSYVPLGHFPWFANQTPAQKYWQAAVAKYNPGVAMGAASSTNWVAAAMLVAAGAELSPTNPTTADLLRGLYQFQGQKWTTLGGLVGPRTFTEGKLPRAPYCLFAAISNADNDGWASSVSTAQCYPDVMAPSDPQANA
jgi:branched-chain amino acid transport system substrate-binding protein